MAEIYGKLTKKDVERLVSMMQEEAFKKHALWIGQMKQASMISEVKRVDSKLNILAG